MIAVLLIVLFTFLLIGFPLVIGLLAGPLIIVYGFLSNVDAIWLPQQMTAGIEVFSLLAVPMFIFAADIMGAGKISDKLLDFVNSFVGHIRGGLAVTTAATCTLFGAISGSSQATVVAIGRPMVTKLLNNGYDEKNTYSLIVNSANIALLIPPSVVMIMYCVVTGSSVGDLFMAAVAPGLIALVLFSIYNIYHAKKNGIPVLEKTSWKERGEAFKEALLPLGFPVIILAGIFSGFFSPTEAAAVSVAYAFIVEVIIYKSLKLKDIPRIALSTGVVTSVVFILVAAGMGFAWVISLARIPQMIVSNVFGPEPSAMMVLAICTLAFFVACMFVDQMVAIIIMAPIFYAPALLAGIDPIHLGVVITLQCAIGSATPPFGCNIFTASAVFNKKYVEVVKGAIPYLLMWVITSILMFSEDIALITLKLFG